MLQKHLCNFGKVQTSKYKGQIIEIPISLSQEVEYLGHYISAQSHIPLPKHIAAIAKCPVPCNQIQPRSFLDMVTFLSKHIPNLSTNTYHLNQLLRKETKWHWSDLNLITKRFTLNRMYQWVTNRWPFYLPKEWQIKHYKTFYLKRLKFTFKISVYL